MFKHLALASAVSALMAFSANAQNTQTTPSDPPAATTTTPSAPSTTTTPSVTTPDSSTATSPSSSASSTTASTAPMLSDDEAKNWVNKTVYSSDGKNLGEVAEILRDNSGRVSELHADIGGFLGIGETRVKVMPDQFKLASDRVILNVPSDQAKSLPHLAK